MLATPGKRTVLVVEDDHALREMYRATLVAAGFSVVAVEDGIDALRYVEGHTPSLVVLDLGLPRLGGEDVRRELAAGPNTRDIPVIVVTGSEPEHLRKTDLVLSKPVSSEGLLAAVERALLGENRPSEHATADSAGRHRRTTMRTVLIVDDEISMRTLLQEFLEEKGYSAKTAGSVGDAVALLEHSVIDAVISDVRMPRQSGLELLKFIRLDRRRRDFPVLLLTGASLHADELAVIARETGCLFHKSANFEPLARHLDRVIH